MDYMLLFIGKVKIEELSMLQNTYTCYIGIIKGD